MPPPRCIRPKIVECQLRANCQYVCMASQPQHVEERGKELINKMYGFIHHQSTTNRLVHWHWQRNGARQPCHLNLRRFSSNTMSSFPVSMPGTRRGCGYLGVGCSTKDEGLTGTAHGHSKCKPSIVFCHHLSCISVSSGPAALCARLELAIRTALEYFLFSSSRDLEDNAVSLGYLMVVVHKGHGVP